MIQCERFTFSGEPITEVEPRFFWFTFAGQRYKSFSHVRIPCGDGHVRMYCQGVDPDQPLSDGKYGWVVTATPETPEEP